LIPLTNLLGFIISSSFRALGDEGRKEGERAVNGIEILLTSSNLGEKWV